MIQPTQSHFTVLKSAMIRPIYHLMVGIYANGYLPINIPTPSHFTVLERETVCPMPIYHLSLGICENGYPLEHIPTNK